MALSGLMAAHGQNLLNSTVQKSEQTRVELLAHAPNGVQAGQRVWLGLQIEHAPDWHTYWKNSGDSGMPTELHWTLPPGVTAGEISWPAPRKFPLGDLANYGYSGTVLLPVPLVVEPTFQGSTLDVQLHATWLVCRKECIPEEGQFKLQLPVAQATAAHQAAFDSAWLAAPRVLNASSSDLTTDKTHLKARLTGLPSAWENKTLEIFPEIPGLIVPGAPWKQTWKGDTWTGELLLSPERSESPTTVPLVLTLVQPPGHGSGGPAVRLEVPVSGGWPAVQVVNTAIPDALATALKQNTPQPKPSAAGLGFWAALLGALAGGLILNLMPCVFPVLAIKVLAFSQQGQTTAARRAAGLAYTAGSVVSFLALGALLMGLRAAGEQLGWGFQLQSPGVVAGLAVLFTLIGLNLAGLFELGHLLPSSWATAQAKHPTADAFLTGVLATAVASPCTAPFMGASLGLAIALPTGQALAVFGALGVGMALPYLVASWWPAVAKALPRPGAWMETFRQVMAFPMWATVVWLLWVLGQQSGIDGAATVLLLLLLLGMLAWAQGKHGRTRWIWTAVAVTGVVWWAIALAHYVTTPVLQNSASTPTGVDGAHWEPWSPGRQTALLAEGRTVFVDYTAAWCVTCQFNKRTALNDSQVLQEVAHNRVALLRADWTRRDPEVTQALAALGRNGVPTYVVHRPNAALQLLPELLTAATVRSAIVGP
jgi:thiol:disulfide interchange protein DsbD